MTTIKRCLIVLVAGLAVVTPVRAQSILTRMRDRARQGVSDRVNNTSDNAVDSALARGDRQVKCIMGDTTCVRKVRAAGRQVVMTDSSGAVLPNQPSQGAAAPTSAAPAAAPADNTASSSDEGSSAPPGAGAWLNYDFVPGDRVLWWEDFAADGVGDFPRRMQLQSGNFEVVTVGGHNYMRTVEGGDVFIVLPDTLPTQFTVEVKYHGPEAGNPIAFRTSQNSDFASWGCYRTSGWVDGGGGGARSSAEVHDVGPNDIVNCRFTISDRYVKGYLNEHRIANVPTTHVAHTDTLYISVPSGEESDPVLFTDLRIAAGGRRLYDALTANGRVATQGILFDTGSDHIRGESTPTLKEIGDMLTQHADLKLTIEGHTDNVGSAASNQSLSERRAAAVKQYLVDQYHIDASRLNSVGFGASHPAAPNTTPEGRQTNRRVELVKN